MLLHLDPQNREVRKNKFLMAPVVDIEIPKALPTSNVVISNQSYSQKEEKLLETKPLRLKQDERIPVNAK